MKRGTSSQIVIHVILSILVLLGLYPFIFMMFTSLKTNGQFYHHLLWPTLPFHFGNYVEAWAAIGDKVGNSALISASSVAMILFTSSLAGYSFARLRYHGKAILYMAVLALLMIPGLLTLIPLFLEVKSFGLLNSYIGLILTFAAGGQAFTVFVFRQSFASLQEELFEAARIEGSSELRVFLRIALPLTLPIFGTMAIWNLLATWNNYLLPLVMLTSSSKFPITVGLLEFQNQFIVETLYGPLFAGYAIASLPLLGLFLVTMRLFMRGLTSGALKM